MARVFIDNRGLDQTVKDRLLGAFPQSHERWNSVWMQRRERRVVWKKIRWKSNTYFRPNHIPETFWPNQVYVHITCLRKYKSDTISHHNKRIRNSNTYQYSANDKHTTNRTEIHLTNCITTDSRRRVHTTRDWYAKSNPERSINTGKATCIYYFESASPIHTMH